MSQVFILQNGILVFIYADLNLDSTANTAQLEDNFKGTRIEQIETKGNQVIEKHCLESQSLSIKKNCISVLVNKYFSAKLSVKNKFLTFKIR